MKKTHIQQILFTTVVILAGCANNGPAPVSDLNRSYSNTSRGEYRGSYYKVQDGDTLYFISYITDKNVNDLIAYNGLTPPYTIYPGQRLNLWRPAYRAPQYGRNTSPVVDKSVEIPISKTPSTPFVASSSVAVAASAATVSKNVASSIIKNSINNSKNEHSHDTTKNKSDVVKKDPVKSIEPTQAKGYGDSTSKKNVNTNIRDTNVNTDQKVDRWLWPTKGRVIRKFSTGDQGNKGIDIAGQRGQAIVSTANGSVVYSGNALRGYGNLIIIKHNDNYLSAYAHNDRLLVKEGQNVVAGQKIATMGSSGTSSVRLHFEIRYQGKSMNPSRYLPK